MNHNPNNVRIGDEVRFLNAVGGGRVARITFDTAWVEDEDGFEIPTPLKECVVVTGEDSFVPAPRPPKLIQDKLQPKKAAERPAASPERPERTGYSQPQRLGMRPSARSRLSSMYIWPSSPSSAVLWGVPAMRPIWSTRATTRSSSPTSVPRAQTIACVARA